MNSFYKNNENTKWNEEIMENFQSDTLKLNNGLRHLIQLYKTLILKKILFLYRNKFSLVAQLLIPGIILISSTLINRNQMEKSSYSPSMGLNGKSFHKLEATIFTDSNYTNHLAQIYKNSIENDNKHAIINSK